jgi:hypothetical protein
MKSEVDRNWYQANHFNKLSGRQVSFFRAPMDTTTRGA